MLLFGVNDESLVELGVDVLNCNLRAANLSSSAAASVLNDVELV